MNTDQPRNYFFCGRAWDCWPGPAYKLTIGLGIRWDLAKEGEATPAVFSFAIQMRFPRMFYRINRALYFALWPVGCVRCRVSLAPSLIRWRA